MPAWDADWELGEELARELIGAHYPDLDRGSLSLVGRGWDNEVWACSGIAFRFPRRRVAVGCLEREIAVLPGLQALPVPIPDGAYPGRPSERFAWPWLGSTFLPGRELAQAGLDGDARVALAEPLAHFLRALHSMLPPASLPVDPNGRADMAVRVPRTRAALAAVDFDAGPLLVEALQLPPPGPVRLLHGDLHARHLLVAGGELTGVIDWGDVCVGDVSVDLSVVFGVLPAAARPRFFDVYGPVDGACEVRARVLALCLCALLAASGQAQGLRWLVLEGLDGLRRAAA